MIGFNTFVVARVLMCIIKVSRKGFTGISYNKIAPTI